MQKGSWDFSLHSKTRKTASHYLNETKQCWKFLSLMINPRFETLLVRSRTSVLALDRKERDQRTSFSHATRTTLRRSLLLSSETLCSREVSAACGAGGGGEAGGKTVSPAAQRQIWVEVGKRGWGLKLLAGFEFWGLKERWAGPSREWVAENGGSSSEEAAIRDFVLFSGWRNGKKKPKFVGRILSNTFVPRVWCSEFYMFYIPWPFLFSIYF